MPEYYERRMNVNKIELIQKLNNVSESYRKDIFMFSQDSDKPATEADLHRLATMNYYAISEITDIIKQLLD